MSFLLLFCLRKYQLLHTRLRKEREPLKVHLHSRSIMGGPDCTCGSRETTQRFLLECHTPRRIYLYSLQYDINAETLIYGDDNVSFLKSYKESQ